MGAFHEHGSHAGPTWPAAALDHNLPLRASCGLTALYAAVNRTRGPELAATAVAPPVKRLHETFPDGTLCLAPDMPLLARRYRFMHAISETDLSQVICATDTYCECERAADGRRQPLVAIKVLNRTSEVFPECQFAFEEGLKGAVQAATLNEAEHA